MTDDVNMDASKRLGRCAICGKDALHAHRPFCSRRCADIDLARWLGGGYVIAGGSRDADEDGDDTAAGAAARTRPAGPPESEE
jgi:hypothetical protein